jgi:hypothetical protein
MSTAKITKINLTESERAAIRTTLGGRGYVGIVDAGPRYRIVRSDVYRTDASAMGEIARRQFRPHTTKYVVCIDADGNVIEQVS